MLRFRALAVLLVMPVLSSRVAAQDHATIVGTWQLTSYENEFQDNGERQPGFGTHSHGYLIFTPQGRMMGYLEADGRKVPTTNEETVAAFTTMAAYTGRYRIEGNKWITKVDGAWIVQWVGTEQERTFELKGNKLSVMTPWIPNPRLGGRMFRGHLTFERED